MNETTSTQPPIVVAGTGGSGTRVVRQVLSSAGVFMGDHLNRSGDAMNFEPWLDRFVDPVLDHTRAADYPADGLPAKLRGEALAELRKAIAAYRAQLPNPQTPWGWKNPRALFLLPLIAEAEPEMRFVQVVRDGRDMALSENQRQVQKHFKSLFGQQPPEHLATASLQMWEKANLQALRWAERELGERHLVIRFEGICMEPERVILFLLESLGIEADSRTLAIAAACIRLPGNIGRWRSADHETRDMFRRLATDGLEAFGYELDADDPGITAAEERFAGRPLIKLREQQERIRELEQQLQEVYGSTSWRLTAPLRVLKRLLFE